MKLVKMIYDISRNSFLPTNVEFIFSWFSRWLRFFYCTLQNRRYLVIESSLHLEIVSFIHQIPNFSSLLVNTIIYYSIFLLNFQFHEKCISFLHRSIQISYRIDLKYLFLFHLKKWTSLLMWMWLYILTP